MMWLMLYCSELSVLTHSQQNLLCNQTWHELGSWVSVTSFALQQYFHVTWQCCYACYVCWTLLFWLNTAASSSDCSLLRLQWMRGFCGC
jgi:hypothetical protein